MKKKLYVITDNNENNKISDFFKKKLIICEKCRKFLGKNNNKNEIITWSKIDIDNCFCNIK